MVEVCVSVCVQTLVLCCNAAETIPKIKHTPVDSEGEAAVAEGGNGVHLGLVHVVGPLPL